MNKRTTKTALSAHKLAFFIATMVVAATAAAGAALLTPGAGITTYPVGGLNAVRGNFVNPTEVKFKIKDGNEEVIRVDEGTQVAMHEITIAPGGHTGWHSHPGPVIVVIKSGEMTFYDGDDPTCSPGTYQPGQAFIDHGQGHAHIARNEGTDPLVIWATYFGVPEGGLYRTDVTPAPVNCGF